MTGLAVILSLSAPAAFAQVSQDAARHAKGAKVTIQGCVVAGEKDGTFLLTHVTEAHGGSPGTGKYGPRFYWLDKTADELKAHVGHTIQVRGTIVDIEESEVEREPGGWNSGVRVAIELPGQDVLTTPRTGGIAPADRANRDDKKITLLKLDVEELTMVTNTCKTS